MNKLKVSLSPSLQMREFSVSRFEELFDLQYFSHLEFENWGVEQWIKKKCARAYKRGKIGQLALWLGKLHAKQLEHPTIPEVSICWINEKIGYGVFSNRSFDQWEFIGEYTGLLRRRNLFFPNINDYCFMYPSKWIPYKPFTIDSAKQGNYTRFINHSDEPNCESVSVFYEGAFHIIFRTIKQIPPNTELTYDYGEIYWHRRKKLSNQNPTELIAPENLKKVQDLS